MPLDPKLIPDVDPNNLPQELVAWINHHCNRGDEGALRLRNLLRELGLPGPYWIYCLWAHDPGKYVRGPLTVQARGSLRSADRERGIPHPI